MARISSVLGLVALLPFLANARTIKFGSKCLGVRSPANDAPTVLVSCSDASAKVDWTYTQPGDNKVVQLTGTNFCLDAGTKPHNNGPAKVFTCYPGTAAQHWYFTGDKRLAITGGSQCLDLSTSSGAPQTYVCTPGNTNQVWTPGPVPTSEPVPPTTTTVISTPAPTATGMTTVQYIHPHNAPSKCLVYDGLYDGARTFIDVCGDLGYPSEFVVKHGDNTAIYVPGTNYCLTTTNDGAAGSSLTVSYCREGGNTQFYYTPDQRIAVTGGTTCLDYEGDGTGVFTSAEFETCKTGDVNQIFTLEDVPATVTSTTAFPDPTTYCHTGQQQILKPAPNTNITKQYPSGKVPFQYCSQYYKTTATLNITVFLASATDKNPAKDGVVVGRGNGNGNLEYDLTLSIPKGTKLAANSQLFVLEYYAEEYGPGPYTGNNTFSEAVKF